LKNKNFQVQFFVHIDGEAIDRSKCGTMMKDLKKNTADMGTSVDVAIGTYIKN
jgi:hypothetical protein